MQNLIKLSLLSILFFYACNKTPVVDFEYDNGRLEAEKEINFISNATGDKSLTWDFGDGTSSTDENPKHTFEKPGNYDVVLTAYSRFGNKGKVSSLSKPINVFDIIKATGSFGGLAFEYKTGVGSNYLANISAPDSSVGNNNYRKFNSGIVQISPAGKNALNITLGNIKYSGTKPSTSEFNSFITAKTYSFSNSGSDGVSISYTDNSGVVWRSTGSQSASNFSISKVIPLAGSNGAKMEFAATFNCTLYNSSGSSKTMNSGYLYCYFEND